MSRNKFVLPITNYLNQKIVFDMLAIIEDGFSQVRSVSLSTNTGSQSDKNTGGEIGIKNVFGLFSANLGRKSTKGRQSYESQNDTEERAHTPTSLFSRLFGYLCDRGLVKTIRNTSSLSGIRNGDFVSFSGTLKRNILLSLLDSIEQMGVMMVRLDKGKAQKDDRETLNQIKSLKGIIGKSDKTEDLICQINDADHLQAVIPIDIDYVYASNLKDLIDGHYNVFGKVLRIQIEDDEGVDLFRNTSFSLFRREKIEELFLSLNDYTDDQINFPEITAIVKPPAILVYPIAIYV